MDHNGKIGVFTFMCVIPGVDVHASCYNVFVISFFTSCCCIFMYVQSQNISYLKFYHRFTQNINYILITYNVMVAYNRFQLHISQRSNIRSEKYPSNSPLFPTEN